jgi:putative NIF3 family GTP cyclohydrolase 1 type 2
VVLQCARAGCAVYSPHTALDAVKGGINDWIVDTVLSAVRAQGVHVPESTTTAVQPASGKEDAEAGAGTGRTCRFAAGGTVNLAHIIAAVKTAMGLRNVQVALPSSLLASTREGPDGVAVAAGAFAVDSFSVCAGSGASVLQGVRASVYITGEMSHHEILAANHAGVAVILTNHSNCERGYLPVLKNAFAVAFEQEARIRGIPAALECTVSAVDADPLVVM